MWPSKLERVAVLGSVVLLVGCTGSGNTAPTLPAASLNAASTALASAAPVKGGSPFRSGEDRKLIEAFLNHGVAAVVRGSGPASPCTDLAEELQDEVEPDALYRAISQTSDRTLRMILFAARARVGQYLSDCGRGRSDSPRREVAVRALSLAMARLDASGRS